MIKAPQLLVDLTRLLKRLEEDLLRRIDEVAELKASLQAEWQAARDADRTAETFETWVDQVCCGRANIDHLCRLNFDQGLLLT